MKRADVVEDAVEVEREPARARGGGETIERGVAAELLVDGVEGRRVVLVIRRRAEDRREPQPVRANGGEVIEPRRHAVEPAEAVDEDLVDDRGHGAFYHGALFFPAAGRFW